MAAHTRGRRRRGRALDWYDTWLGAMPDCERCAELLFSPFFAESVYSVSIEYAGTTPADLARRTITGYHDRDHKGE